MTRAPDTIETARLTGHRVNDGDQAYLFETDGDMRVQKTLFGKVQTEEQSRARLQRWMQMWEEHGFGFWIFTDHSGATVGHGGVFPSPREAGEIEVGYVVKPAFWGRGLATEITRVSLDIGFGTLGLERIIGIAQVTNAPSRRVMEKCGMVFEARIPSFDGIDGARYAIAKTASRFGE